MLSNTHLDIDLIFRKRETYSNEKERKNSENISLDIGLDIE